MTKPTLNEIERFFNPQPPTTIQPKQPVTIGFKKLTEDATMPTKAHADDSGFDLVASEDVIVEPGATVVVPTGIAVQLPKGYEATVRPRSGVTAKTKLRVQLGTIDNGFTGSIGVIVDNIAETNEDNDPCILLIDNTVTRFDDGSPSNTYFIRKGDKIAQIVITRLPEVVGTEVFEIDKTVRGSNGFGSTGV